MSKATLPPFRPFTPRQMEVRNAIVELQAELGREPTLGEIRRRLDLAAHSYVGRVVRKLKIRKQYPSYDGGDDAEEAAPVSAKAPQTRTTAGRYSLSARKAARTVHPMRAVRSG